MPLNAAGAPHAEQGQNGGSRRHGAADRRATQRNVLCTALWRRFFGRSQASASQQTRLTERQGRGRTARALPHAARLLHGSADKQSHTKASSSNAVRYEVEHSTRRGRTCRLCRAQHASSAAVRCGGVGVRTPRGAALCTSSSSLLSPPSLSAGQCAHLRGGVATLWQRPGTSYAVVLLVLRRQA